MQQIAWIQSLKPVYELSIQMSSHPFCSQQDFISIQWFSFGDLARDIVL